MQGVPLRKEKLDKFFANEGYLHHFDLKFETCSASLGKADDEDYTR
jgi:hypothetical protein